MKPGTGHFVAFVSPSHPETFLESVSVAASALLLAGGSLVIFGWMFDIQWLKKHFAGLGHDESEHRGLFHPVGNVALVPERRTRRAATSARGPRLRGPRRACGVADPRE